MDYHASGKRRGLWYKLEFNFLNATDYGVPQRRERVFIVGFRSDLEVEWKFPAPTHSMDSLLRTMWATGEYWERHRIPRSSVLNYGNTFNPGLTGSSSGVIGRPIRRGTPCGTP